MTRNSLAKIGFFCLILLFTSTHIATAVDTYMITEIGTLSGWEFFRPSDVNDSGQVVGGSWVDGAGYDGRNAMHAVYYDDLAGPVDLGTPFMAPTDCQDVGSDPVESKASFRAAAEAINASGAIAGYTSCKYNTVPPGVNTGTAWVLTAYDAVPQDIGHLDDGVAFTEARDINNLGEVVGISWLTLTCPTCKTYRAFIWNQTDGIRSLESINSKGPTGPSEAYAINDNSTVVGYMRITPDDSAGVPCSNSALRAFVWTADSGFQDLGALSECGWSVATDINDLGEIVGYSDIDPSPAVQTYHAFLYRDGEMIDLGVVPPDESASARAINNQSQVVGQRYAPGLLFPTSQSGVLWENDAPFDLEDLLAPGADEWGITHGTAISNSGLIVGRGTPAGEVSPAGFIMSPYVTIDGCDTGVLEFNNDFSIDFTCLDLNGIQFSITADYTGNGFVWEFDLDSLEILSSQNGCLSINSDLSIDVTCIELGGVKFSFTMNYTGEGLKWEIDLASIVVL